MHICKCTFVDTHVYSNSMDTYVYSNRIQHTHT